jgi:hypothetical protein
MRRSIVLSGIDNPEVRSKVNTLKRKSFYFVKGYLIDDVPLQLTHFYKDYLRFKILAWPEHSANGKYLVKTKDIIRQSRIKVGRPPLTKSNHSMSKKERFEIRRQRREAFAQRKAYINLNYGTLQKAQYITFEEILYEDLPLFISDASEGTHLKDVLGVKTN